MDPAERQDCKSLLAHDYFNNYRELQGEIDNLLEQDNKEFKIERIRRLSNERTERSYLNSSPTFDTIPAKNQETKKISMQNKSWGRKDGTPSFNKIADKAKVKLINLREEDEKNNDKDYNDEFNISFTNENYNPMTQMNKKRSSNERSKLNKEDIIINTQDNFGQNSKPSKLIHLSEVYNSKRTGKSVRVLQNKKDKKELEEKFQTPAHMKYGSPIPGQRNKFDKLKTSEVKPPIAVLEPSSGAFPDLLNGNNIDEDKEENSGLMSLINNKKKRKPNRDIIPDFKIFDLQHNLMNLNCSSQIFFSPNGEIMDSTSLREELRASKENNKDKRGKLTKPKNPFDLGSVTMRPVITTDTMHNIFK
mmetsp:Transcript_5377/g.4565  ORF Transcript_5377/g.4565 Transcript_5377/m.4565 type:complete len:362 (+) Transcript_5377:312-1397(+)